MKKLKKVYVLDINYPDSNIDDKFRISAVRLPDESIKI